VLQQVWGHFNRGEAPHGYGQGHYFRRHFMPFRSQPATLLACLKGISAAMWSIDLTIERPKVISGCMPYHDLNPTRTQFLVVRVHVYLKSSSNASHRTYTEFMRRNYKSNRQNKCIYGYLSDEGEPTALRM